jgi:hypothetical protein
MIVPMRGVIVSFVTTISELVPVCFGFVLTITATLDVSMEPEHLKQTKNKLNKSVKESSENSTRTNPST